MSRAAVAAGSTATVGFTVEHGCEGSPTVELRFQVPESITDAQPGTKDGWTTAVDGRVVSFTGGPLDPDTADSFPITFTAPTEPGTIYFPVVQRCETGELPWIAIPAAGGEEPDLPAPAIQITDGPPTSADAAGAGDDAGSDGHDGHGSDDTGESAADGTAESEPGGVDGGLIAAGIGAVVIVAGAAVLLRRRRDTTG